MFRRLASYYFHLIAGEISTVTAYYDHVIQFMPRTNDSGDLLKLVKCPKKSCQRALLQLPDLSLEKDIRTAVLLNGNFNHDCDVQDTLTVMKAKLSRTTRVIAVLYNPYLSWLFSIATTIGLRKGSMPTTFITRADLDCLARLSGFEIVRSRPVAYCPWRLYGLGNLINRVSPIIPLVRLLSFAHVVVLRPVISSVLPKPSLSVVIPARNEYGNIESAVSRMPNLGCALEIIFVEGHSKDNTWDEIQRVSAAYRGPFQISSFQQTGKGKSEAVRLGFSKAKGELLTILDADLTMPPEKLGLFYEAYCLGLADFVNGSRLVYPMENQAMRPLNKLGNKFFAKLLGLILGNQITDSLCGTKLLARHDYARMISWRKDFGEFDPFGDFELIFPAAIMGLGTIDIPIAYKNRIYGSTQIRRFYHGFMLLRMVWVGFFKITLGKV